ncbi:hypothetical protein GY45DRAFT_879420 [Cubamyces sp. BRFM 1775]|nr:hypothetical protein GY45DRAFT_879420 [Cubamyces sp. BRFM 1775]
MNHVWRPTSLRAQTCTQRHHCTPFRHLYSPSCDIPRQCLSTGSRDTLCTSAPSQQSFIRLADRIRAQYRIALVVRPCPPFSSSGGARLFPSSYADLHQSPTSISTGHYDPQIRMQRSPSLSKPGHSFPRTAQHALPDRPDIGYPALSQGTIRPMAQAPHSAATTDSQD